MFLVCPMCGTVRRSWRFQQREVVLVSSPAIVIKQPDQSNLREKEFTLGHNSSYSLTLQGRKGTRSLGKLAILYHNQEQRAVMNAGVQFAFSISSESLVQGMVPLPIGMNLSTSTNILKTGPLQSCPRLISKVTTDSAKLSINTNHHSRATPKLGSEIMMPSFFLQGCGFDVSSSATSNNTFLTMLCCQCWASTQSQSMEAKLV